MLLHELHRGVWVIVDARFVHWDHRHFEPPYHLHRHPERHNPQPYGAILITGLDEFNTRLKHEISELP